MKDLIKIIRYSWDLKRYYIPTIILVIVSTVIGLVSPFLTKRIVDGLTQMAAGHPPAHSFYVWPIVGLLGIGIAVAVISNIQGYIGDQLGAKLNTLLSTRYYRHILQLPLEYYDNEVAGKITNRLERSITTISQLITAFANNFVGMILGVVLSLAVIAYYAWPVALLLALLFPLYIWLTSLSSKRWQTYQEGINTDMDINNGRFIEAVNQIRVVKSFVQEITEGNFFAGKRHAIERETKAQSLGWHWYDTARRAGLAVIFALIYVYITWAAVTGRLSIGQLVLLLQLIITVQFPLGASSFIVDNLQRAQAGSRDFFGVMDTKPTIVDEPGAGSLTVTKGEVAFSDIKFAYGDGQVVLNDISFTVKHGTKLALVGESGQGKTTISNLLLRLYHLDGGKIIIDGQDIAKVSQSSLREAIGVVFQEPALFSGTVRDNIAYGTPKASLEAIKQAAAAANADGFIDKLPHGFDTEIGERGVKLSGGQRQRLAIARAILKDAPILILDEATSSLDSKAEAEVQSALDQLMKGRTTLIIAHRLSTIARVDMIVGLKDGRVLEQGTPDELAHGKGIYSELLALQNPTEDNKKKLAKYEMAG
ncbi:ABC transporter ATP-binding protein [Candidatus Saccharibacteria bacterium]|nr:ABC transporter ATP-binding protein [Candidatus Saccharibacteria bacterium]